MKAALLKFPGMAAAVMICSLITMAASHAVDTGTYHCTPVHSVHYLAQDDGKMAEFYVGTNHAMIIIKVDNTSISILDNRANKSRSIDIVSNAVRGSVIGKSGTRQFYMDPVLHYFYGSIEKEGTVAYAEEGRCRKY